MKKRSVFLIIMMLILTLSNTIFAFASGDIKDPKPEVPTDISNMGSTILGVIQWAGYAIAVGMLLYIGIKYMMSAANEKASLKQSLINYFIGAVVLIGVVTIFSVVVGFFNGEEISGENTGTVQTPAIGTPAIGGGTTNPHGGGRPSGRPELNLKQ